MSADVRDPTTTPSSRSPLVSADPAAPLTRTTGWVLGVGGAVGAAAALALLLDRISLLQNPAFVPSCSMGPVLTCTPVMNSWQAEVFGFPNPVLGVIAFPIVTTLGVVTLAGAVLPRWIWLGLQLGVTLGGVFVLWLISQSLFVIGALCPWCMVVWVATISVFWYVTLHTVTARRPCSAPVLRRVVSFHSAVLAAALLVLVALVVVRFWSPWSGLFS